jgi:hypothetical protein
MTIYKRIIDMTGEELADAIDYWLKKQGVKITGPRTVYVNDELCEHAEVTIRVDPRGAITHETLGR